jgi:hypothetical protein
LYFLRQWESSLLLHGKRLKCHFICDWQIQTEPRYSRKNGTVHSFLPTFLFPRSTSLIWRRNFHRHCPNRMVPGFVAKAQNSGIALFSFHLWLLSPLRQTNSPLCELSRSIFPQFPRVLTKVFIIFQDLHAVRTSQW